MLESSDVSNIVDKTSSIVVSDGHYYILKRPLVIHVHTIEHRGKMLESESFKTTFKETIRKTMFSTLLNRLPLKSKGKNFVFLYTGFALCI